MLFRSVGEQIDDLQPFKPTAFADGLFDKIEYKEEEDISIEVVEESKEELEEVNEDILQKEELSDEYGGNVEEPSETGIQFHRIMANRWGNNGNSDRLYFLGLQSHCGW